MALSFLNIVGFVGDFLGFLRRCCEEIALKKIKYTMIECQETTLDAIHCKSKALIFEFFPAFRERVLLFWPAHLRAQMKGSHGFESKGPRPLCS